MVAEAVRACPGPGNPGPIFQQIRILIFRDDRLAKRHAHREDSEHEIFAQFSSFSKIEDVHRKNVVKRLHMDPIDIPRSIWDEGSKVVLPVVIPKVVAICSRGGSSRGFHVLWRHPKMSMQLRSYAASVSQ